MKQRRIKAIVRIAVLALTIFLVLIVLLQARSDTGTAVATAPHALARTPPEHTPFVLPWETRVSLAGVLQGCDVPWDVNDDGVVNMVDIQLVAERWRARLGDPNYVADYDLNSDQVINVVDIMLVAVHWGEVRQFPGGGLVWAEGSSRKVLLTDPAPASILRQAQDAAWVWDSCHPRLHAARNETEPVQLVITAGTQPLTGVTVAVSNLRLRPEPFAGAQDRPVEGLATGSGVIANASATIDQAQITLYREAYYTVSQPSDPYGYGLPAGVLVPGAIPDVLIPFEDPYNPGQLVGVPFDVPAGQNQPIWIDLAVPSGTPPGTYQGTATVTTDQGSLSLPLELVVWNFTLPAQPSVFISFPMDPLWTLPPQYGVSANDKNAIYALTDKHFEALADHRLAPMSLYLTPAVTEVAGQVQLDWTQADPLYQHWLDTYGLLGFYVPDVYDGDNDRYHISDGTGTPYTQADFNDPTFVDKAKQYYAAVRDHLASQGWWDRAWAYPDDETEWVADEPMHNGSTGHQRLEAWAQLLREVNTDYRITASSVYPVPVGPPDRGWPDLKGLVDDWNVVVQDADLDPALWESRLALGETLSFYHNDWGDFLDYKATLHRGLGWVAYKYGAWAVTGWAAAAWIGENTVDVVNPWTAPVTPVYGYGGGALFWPGHHIEGDQNKNVDGPLPSIRLKLAREAVEDHDYLTLLAAQTSSDYAQALVRGLIPRDYWDWDPSPEAIYALRNKIGQLLDSDEAVPLATVLGQVTDAGSGAPIQGTFVSDGESGALTDTTGHYTLTVGLPAAATLSLASDVGLSFSAHRYQAANRTVTVSAGGQVTQDVALTRVAEQSLLLYSFETAAEIDDNWDLVNIISSERVTSHVTDGDYALKVAFNDNLALAEADDWPTAGAETFATGDWSSYTALEFDVYNESDYYTNVDVLVMDAAEAEYPQTGGTISLLPNQSRHVVIPIDAIAASGVDLTDIAWLEIAPETITEQEDYQGQANLWRVGPRTLYLDNLRLVQVVSE